MALRTVTVGISALVLAISGLVTGTAQAAPAVSVGSGTAIVIDGQGACTMTASGHDRAGRLVAMTAGHCGDVGSTISLEDRPSLGNVGRFVGKNPKLDYAIIQLDAAKVSAGRGKAPRALRGVGGFPAEGKDVCKTGRTTGNTCGRVLENWPRSVETLSYVCAAPGDSGGAVFAGDRLVGILNGGAVYRVPLTQIDLLIECHTPALPIYSPMVATRADVVFADLNRRDVIGSGFRIG